MSTSQGGAVRLPLKPAVEARTFVTPEGVDLRLRIGTASERASAFILDAVFLLVGLILLILAFFLGLAAFGKKGTEMMLVVLILGFFLLRNVYFVAFELTPRAATPGKLIMGLRVAARDGGRLTAEAIFARNAMREIEVFMPAMLLLGAGAGGEPVNGWLTLLALTWTGIFMLFPLFNRDRLRVGDLIAGTWVLKAARPRLDVDLTHGHEANRARFDFTIEQMSAYGVKELHVLEDVLRLRDPKTMAAVAYRIRTKIGWVALPGEVDGAFLFAYYGALRGRLESRLLFGHRRRDKFDAA